MGTVARLVRPTALLGVALCLGFIPLAAARSQGAASITQIIHDCKQITDTSRRLACFDALPDSEAGTKSGAATKAPDVVIQSPRATSPQSALPAAAAASGNGVRAPQSSAISTSGEPAEASPTYGLPPRRDKSENNELITVRVSKTGSTGDGKLRVITTEGMVWDQIYGDPAAPPKTGAEIKISAGAMGSHWCEVNKWTSFKCARIDRPEQAPPRAQCEKRPPFARHRRHRLLPPRKRLHQRALRLRRNRLPHLYHLTRQGRHTAYRRLRLIMSQRKSLSRSQAPE